MTHDDDFSDKIAVLALGALPAAEAAETAAHVRTCAECRREYDALRATADLVGFEAELAPDALDELTSARLKSRVMRAVRAEASAPPLAPAPAPSVPAAAIDAHPRTPEPRRSTRWPLVAAAALALAILAGVQDVVLRNAREADRQHIAALERDRAGLAERLALVVAPGAKHYPVNAGEVVTSHGRIVLALTHLAPPPDGKVYQAWTLARGAKAMSPSVTFSPNADGTAYVELPESARGIALVAVDVEPAGGGSKLPTAKPNFVRSLS
jgi:hypothetical protein